MTPEAASLRARIAAHTRWAGCEDRTDATSKARAAFMDRFERQVDPDGTLPPEVRAKLAKSAKSAYYSRLAYARHHK